MNGNIKLSKWIAPAILGCLLLSAPAQGASFDCGKAGMKVEHIICDDPEISKLDEELAVSYKAVLKDRTQANAIRQAQRQWLKERNRCEAVACVKQIFEVRLSELKKLLAAMPEPNTKYLMMSGKGKAICEQVFKQMNEGPELCAMDMLARIPGVELPKWKKLDWQENKLLYERFLLAQMVKEEYYPQLFGGQGPGGEEIPIPTKEQRTKGWYFVLWGATSHAQLTRELLEKEWEGAIDAGNEFYRWDGAVPAPDETDVILVETQIHRFQGGCPTVRMIPFSENLHMPKFSADMDIPKPWFSRNSKWRIYPGELSFKFDAQNFSVREESGLSRDEESGMLAVPFRTLNIRTAIGSYCSFHTNYAYRAR